ncbi:hypothetical protein BGW38_009031 [Lunasporangiospora selenospora]|uniref:Hamartin protein n=1 Tax=Lunasporangiospora selenospora TaxID=979761 RepID=A0A9P6KG28_9FUNG|nr:hypothetical protein BGW38_009031 [Lunasporangiospora selenospora]
MSGSAPTIKDLYRVITADLATYVVADRSKDSDSIPQREQIQAYIDRFVKSNPHHPPQHPHQHASPLTPSNAAAHASSLLGIGNIVPTTVLSASAAAAMSTTSQPNSHPASVPGQRHASELWYTSLPGSASLPTHTSGLPFAFHRLFGSSPASSSPESSGPTSQSVSASGSPVFTTGGTNQHSGSATPNLGTFATATLPTSASPMMHPSAPVVLPPNTSTVTPLASQRFSAHLVTLYTQHAQAGSVSIASLASRMIVYLTHLLPFLTPQLVIADWWNRLIEPSFHGEIKLEKSALKACRELVVECMVRDPLWDGHGSNTGSVLVAGDEEGQLDSAMAMTALPIPQLILRKYIKASHRLNHRLADEDKAEDSANWQRTKSSYHGQSGRGSIGSLSLPTMSSPVLGKNQSLSQDLEAQKRLVSKSQTVSRRKRDFLVRNLESVLLNYGSNVGRVKDFFSCLYTYFVGARFRAEILNLLCQFIRRQYDTSPVIVSLGLMTLIMLMPRIPSTLNDRLPDLFLILSRTICWPRSMHQLATLANQGGNNMTGPTMQAFDEFDDEEAEAASRSKQSSLESLSDHVEYEDIPLYIYGIRWRRYGPKVPGGDPEGAPDPIAIFSFLYGMFPCNLLQFLRAPRQYLSKTQSRAGSPRQGSGVGDSGEVDGSSISDPSVLSPNISTSGADSVFVDEDMLKARIQPLFKRHSLHPDLLLMSCEQEVANKARWQKLEPMEIVAMCVGLDVWFSGIVLGTGPTLRSIEEDKRNILSQESESESEDEGATSDHAPSINLNRLRSEESGSESNAPSIHDGETRAQQEQDVTTDTDTAKDSAKPEGSDSTAPDNIRQESTFVLRSTLEGVLRGLNPDEYLLEIARRNPGQSILVNLRRPSKSVTKDSEGQFNPSPPPPVATGVAAHPSETDIPIGEYSESEPSSLIPESEDPTFSTLSSLNQEYRRMIVHLERDLLMARNELNFELFLKQQHIQQISKVHRAHVVDASVEAERQALYNTCRSLKAQLQETKFLLEKDRNELNQRKVKQTHWDTELKSKLQTFREERKLLNHEVDRLKLEISDTRQQQVIQERLLNEERKGTFNLQNKIEDLSPRLKLMEEYEKRIQEMTRQLVLWEGEQIKGQELQRQMEAVASRWQNLEYMLAAEREESRVLRSRISQKSQAIDDMRIQLTTSEGGDVVVRSLRPSIEFPSEDDGSVDPLKDAHDGDDGERRVSDMGGYQAGVAGQTATFERVMDRHREELSSWSVAMSRSNSHTGASKQLRGNAIQEFMVREKERWDQELQQAHNRLSREAGRNQQLEDRILELQIQLETARAIDMRQRGGGSGSGGGGGGGGGRNIGRQEDSPGGPLDLAATPSQPRNVPQVPAGQGPMRMMHHEGTEEDTDDSGMIGRYRHRRHETEDEEESDTRHAPVLRRSGTEGDLTSSHVRRPILSGASSSSALSKAAKGKGKTKASSRSKWLPAPSTLERAQTDRGAYALGNNPTYFGIGHQSSSGNRRSADSTSTAGSGTTSARAAAGGFLPPVVYKRQMSHVSDGGVSDVTVASDASTTGSTGGAGGDGNHAGGSLLATTVEEGVETSEASEGGGSSRGGKKSKAEREKERERERTRLLSGMGPLVDPSKMYRNVRMF